MKRITIKALGVTALFAGFGLNAAFALPPAPKAEEMAAVQPKQAGVEVSVLAPADLARCRVEPYPNAQAPAGYVLLDSANRPVRRFLALNTPNFNMLSFYNDGEEVYREFDSKGAGKVDQYRWLGSNGGKIGRDVDGNGSIDVWDTITPEEVSKELFEAIVSKDANRLKALMPTEAELKSLGLSPAEIARVTAKLNAAAQRFNQTISATALTPKAKWIHVEFFLPETTPMDAFGGAADIVRHRNGGVLFEKGDGKSADFFQTGELVKIGNAWRVIDGPAPGQPQAPKKGVEGGGGDEIPEIVKPLFDELQKLKDPGGAGSGKYHADRAAILEKIVATLNGHPAQPQWMRQLIEAHASAAEYSEKGAAERLAAWKDQIEKFAPKSPLAGFASFRSLSVDYIIRLKAADKPEKMAETQKWWRDELEKWVTAYPAIDETPEALYRLAMAHEFNGKVGESTAINFYMTLAKNFATHPLAAQSTGAANRLASEGKPFAFTNCVGLADGKPFDSAKLAGKVVVVYFWGSFGDSAKLKQDAAYFTDLVKKHGAKIEIVTIALDPSAQQAVAAINAVQLPGTHLISPNGAMPTAWGIMGQHIILIEKSGKVDDKNASIPQLGDAIDKLVK